MCDLIIHDKYAMTVSKCLLKVGFFIHVYLIQYIIIIYYSNEEDVYHSKSVLPVYKRFIRRLTETLPEYVTDPKKAKIILGELLSLIVKIPTLPSIYI